MRKVATLVVLTVVLANLLSGSVLAADNSGIRPTAMSKGRFSWVTPMADNSGIRPY